MSRTPSGRIWPAGSPTCCGPPRSTRSCSPISTRTARSGPPARPARTGRAGSTRTSRARSSSCTRSASVRGYSQTDVTEFAELLTGLTFNIDDGFQFRPRWAEPGAERVLGRRLRRQRPGDDRTTSSPPSTTSPARPATAAHLARKLAVHFVSDDPDPGLVARDDGGLLAQRRRPRSGLRGDARPSRGLGAARARRRANRSNSSPRPCARSAPTEARLAALKNGEIRRLILRPLARMGQPYEEPPGPDGWPEAAEAWITPPALAERISWAMNVQEPCTARRCRSPRAFVDDGARRACHRPAAPPCGRAESKRAGVGLVLASPAFNRR